MATQKWNRPTEAQGRNRPEEEGEGYLRHIQHRFLGPNATVGQFSAIFWIETVEYDGRQFLQLQYTQTVLLNFADLSWPHVSVATLRKVT